MDIPDGAVVVPYSPFPAFSEWRGVDFDTHLFSQFESLFTEAREAATHEVLDRALEAAMKWAAVDTGAIENLYQTDRGFTFSVAVEAAAWNAISKVKGEEVAHAIDDAMKSYEYVLDAATKQVPLSEKWIKEVHSIACKSQKTYVVVTDAGPQERALPKGQYKVESNSPLNLASNMVHSYAPPMDVVSEMGRFVSELRGSEFERAHPVIQAAYAHYAFVAIHPFADGNGRVARALASVFLYRRPGLPLVVFADQKPEYLDALEAADSGNYSVLTQFIGDRAIDTMGMVRDEVSTGGALPVDEQLASIDRIVTGRGGLAHTEVDALANRLTDALKAAFEKKISESDFKKPLSTNVRALNGAGGKAVEGYRPVPNATSLTITVASAAPASAEVQRTYRTIVARPDNTGPDFLVLRGGGELTQVFLRDISPTVSQSLSYRMESIARNEMSAMLAQVTEQAAESLRKAGYA